MTEYATTPSAIEEWRNQRSRTEDWVQHYATPGLPPTPSSSSDSDNRSLWSGHGWEPPSDCESSTSVPPTMMLRYPDSRQVMVSPVSAGEGGDSKRVKNRNGSGHRTNHAYIAHGDEERTERARSLRSAEHVPTHTHTHATVNTNPASISRDIPRSSAGRATTKASASANAGAGASAAANPSQTSSMRLARAAAAPLPDSHSSSSVSAVRSGPVSAGGAGSAFPRSVPKGSSDAVPFGEAADVAGASHIATSTHSHSSHIAPRSDSRPNSNRAPSHTPTTNAPVPSGQPSHVPTHPPSYHPSHASSQRRASRVASNATAPLASSHQPSARSQSGAPSHAPSHQLSQNQVPSEHLTQQPSHAATNEPSQAHVPSHQPSQAVSHRSQVDATPSHPPSVFSNHTVTPGGGSVIPPQPDSPSSVNGAPGVPSPPSIHSIHSRAISVSDSRSSGPPEQIFVHPPTNPSVNSVHPAANVPLPPSSIASASLSYFSVPPRRSHDYEQQHQEQKDFAEAREEERRGSIAPSHHTSQSQQQQNGHTYNGQLPTPISPTPNTSLPVRAPSTSTMSGSGLGGGYVLIDVPSAGYEEEVERELSQRKGSDSGGKSERQKRERGSLFGMFGKHGGGHTRSKSLPMSGMDVPEEGNRGHEKEIPVSPSNLRPRSNPYPTPISPLSPNADPLAGPHPPPIVYAPARHHRATRYSPPRIMYSPRGSRQKYGYGHEPGQKEGERKREVPYDMQHPPGQGLYSVLSPSPYPQMHPQYQQYQYPYQQHYAGGSPVVYIQSATPLMSPGYLHGYSHGHSYATEHATLAGVGSKGSPGSVRHSRTLQETPGLVRDSGWDEGRRDTMRPGSGYKHHSANVGDIIVHDSFTQVPGESFSRPHSHVAPAHSPRASPSRSRSPVPTSPNRSNVNVNPNTASMPASPTMSQVATGIGREGSIRSDATSTRTNLAGVGTVSVRSRSRGRSVAQNGDLGHISEGEGEGEAEVGVMSGRGESIREMDARGRSRSRSRARGMVYSTSAPQPQTHVHGIEPPHAVMMIPPREAMTERSVKETPYPTPPASVSEQALLQQKAMQGGHGGHARGVVSSPKLHLDGSAHLNGSHAPAESMNDASPSPSGLASRFHDIYHTQSPRGVIPSHLSPPRSRGDYTSYSSRERGRRRARERRGSDGRVRSASVDSDASCSSVSTYYVLPSPGQKVRIVRTDGVPTTTTTTVSRNNSGVGAGSGSGWLRKAAALRPKFLHRDHTNTIPQSQPQPKSHPHPQQSEASLQKSWYHSQSNSLAGLEAPVLDSRTTSGGADSARSGKSGKSGKRGGRKLVRRNSTGSAALLNSVDATGATGDGGVTRHEEEDGEDMKVPVDIVIPGR